MTTPSSDTGEKAMSRAETRVSVFQFLNSLDAPDSITTEPVMRLENDLMGEDPLHELKRILTAFFNPIGSDTLRGRAINFAFVCDELNRQWDKFGEQNHSKEKWLAILMEEVGEAAKEALDGNDEDFAIEVVQVAAVAINMLI